MAGVKGRSGGARPNSGPKPRGPQPLPAPVVRKTPEPEPQAVASEGVSPLEFLLAVMRDPAVDGKLRLDAAKTAAQYCHLKKGDGGIKDETAEKAKKAGAGKFGAAAPPKLIVNNGR